MKGVERTEAVMVHPQQRTGGREGTVIVIESLDIWQEIVEIGK